MNKKLAIFLSVALVWGVIGIQNVFAFNIAEGKSVSLFGSFFTEYLDWSTGRPDGSPSSQGLIDSIVDGVFLEEGTQWDQGTLWWDTHYPMGGLHPWPVVFIDLGQDYWIDSFIVQADDNDAYAIAYFNESELDWINITAIGGWGMRTRPEYILPDAILTSLLMITAIGGDGFYSLSEVQAFGESTPVPEPTTMLLLGTGLIGLAGIGRKKLFKK